MHFAKLSWQNDVLGFTNETNETKGALRGWDFGSYLATLERLLHKLNELNEKCATRGGFFRGQQLPTINNNYFDMRVIEISRYRRYRRLYKSKIITNREKKRQKTEESRAFEAASCR